MRKKVVSIENLSSDFHKLQKLYQSTNDELQLQSEKNSSLRESLSRKYEIIERKGGEVDKLNDHLNLLRINNGT